MLTGRPSLVSVFLCFVCLLALSPHPAARRCSQDIIKKVKLLIKQAPNMTVLESRLYTPNITDYEQECASSALKCFAAEVKVLTEEWKEVGVKFTFKLDKMLRDLAKSFNQAESNCLQCELLQEENAVNFLDCLLSTLQQMNNLYCTW